MDAAIITLMITMMCHLSCGQAVNGLHWTPVPGRARGWGRDVHIQGSRGNNNYLSFHTYSMSREALHTHGPLNPYNKPRKWAI